ncbi:alcohol oxidase [Dendrothele bispora CBS 962.96]|uniref:Alcohol oxidase n=1 Tax=Dendrothele bispora (strain CBS 962.96) TaxID=1314807 RepID=A0A4S8MWK2_DENBC|nr:alcohol oxidase [Dendrothele bispora CBS 962.96]
MIPFVALSILSATTVLSQSATYDYVVVGGGTAGLTVAVRLSELANVSVAVLEAGGTGIGNPNITDLRNRFLPYDTPIDWALPTLPQNSANGRVYTQRQGKVLGGSSAINGAVYVRPDIREFAAIEALGAKGWTWNNFLQYFKKSEHFYPETDELTGGQNYSAHGFDGPISVSYGFNVSSFFKDYAIPTIENLGTMDDDMSDGTPIGGHSQQLSLFPGTYNRSYVANSYFWPNQDRENLHVFTDSLVSKIIWGEDENGLAVANGVEYLTEDGTGVLNARHVILSAGALQSTKVLELSGVGDPAVLKNLGIENKIELANVGKNLQNQLGVNVIYALKNGSVTLGSETSAPVTGLLPAQQVLSDEDMEISNEIRSTKGDDLPEAQYEALQKLIEDGLAQTEMNWSLTPQADGTVQLRLYVTDLHTFSRGYVHANSSDPTAKVTIDPKYLSAEHDLWYLSKAVAYTRNITSTEPLASVIDSELAPGANYSSSEDIQEWLLPNFITMSHFVGTTAALPLEDGGVVDPESFIVYGTSNVRVVDCGVIPLLPGIHTESIAYALGEMAADVIKKTEC